MKLNFSRLKGRVHLLVWVNVLPGCFVGPRVNTPYQLQIECDPEPEPFGAHVSDATGSKLTDAEALPDHRKCSLHRFTTLSISSHELESVLEFGYDRKVVANVQSTKTCP